MTSQCLSQWWLCPCSTGRRCYCVSMAYQKISRYAVDTPHTHALGSSFTLWIHQTHAVESPRCAWHTPRALRAPSNFEHVKKNRRAIAEHTLRSRCAVNAQCRSQRRRACVECMQPVHEWSQLIRECTQLIREWSPHQRRILTQHC